MNCDHSDIHKGKLGGGRYWQATSILLFVNMSYKDERESWKAVREPRDSSP